MDPVGVMKENEEKPEGFGEKTIWMVGMATGLGVISLGLGAAPIALGAGASAAAAAVAGAVGLPSVSAGGFGAIIGMLGGALWAGNRMLREDASGRDGVERSMSRGSEIALSSYRKAKERMSGKKPQNSGAALK